MRSLFFRSMIFFFAFSSCSSDAPSAQLAEAASEAKETAGQMASEMGRFDDVLSFLNAAAESHAAQNDTSALSRRFKSELQAFQIDKSALENELSELDRRADDFLAKNAGGKLNASEATKEIDSFASAVQATKASFEGLSPRFDSLQTHFSMLRAEWSAKEEESEGQ